MGVVIRDHEGNMIGALSERIALPPSVEDVEHVGGRFHLHRKSAFRK